MSFLALFASRRVTIAVGILAVLLIGLAVVSHFRRSADRSAERAIEQATDAGRADATATATQKGLDHVIATRRAHEAARTDPAVLRAECLRDSRTPQHCPSAPAE